MAAGDPHQPLRVTVVSKNPSTLVGLDRYLQGVGVVTTTTGALDRLLEMTPPAASAVIFFPDEYGAKDAISALVALMKARPAVLAVIVTNDPRRFARPGDVDAATSLLVMPKPAWAWTILEAVRARLEQSPHPSPIPRPCARRPGRPR